MHRDVAGGGRFFVPGISNDYRSCCNRAAATGDRADRISVRNFPPKEDGCHWGCAARIRQRSVLWIQPLK